MVLVDDRWKVDRPCRKRSHVRPKVQGRSPRRLVSSAPAGRELDDHARAVPCDPFLHSGEAFGGPMVILSDIAAVALVLTLVTGYWLWIVPKLSRSSQARDPEAAV